MNSNTRCSWLIIFNIFTGQLGDAIWTIDQRPVPGVNPMKLIFVIIYIKKGFNKLNFTVYYINFDVIYAKKVL